MLERWKTRIRVCVVVAATLVMLLLSLLLNWPTFWAGDTFKLCRFLIGNGQNSTSPTACRSLKVDASESDVWDVVVKTCNKWGAATDAYVYLKLYYERDYTDQTLLLDTANHNDFEQGQIDYYRVRLNQNDLIHMGLYWRPTGPLFPQHWCADWVVLLNAKLDLCYGGVFFKWIGRHGDPPTYPAKFRRMRYVECVFPGAKSHYAKQQYFGQP